MGVGASNSHLDLWGDSLPSDTFVTHFSAEEALSNPFWVRVGFCTNDAGFCADDLLKSRALLTVTSSLHEQRWFDGMVRQARFCRVVAGKLYFEVELRPALLALVDRQDCRIFQEKNVRQIVQQVLDEAGVGERVEWRLRGSYPARDFVVQYRETAFNFVSRLLEDAGIFYFFNHSEDGHDLVFADAPEVFETGDCAPLSLSPGLDTLGEPVRQFARRRSLRASSVHLRDYDFLQPGSKPEAIQPGTDAWPSFYYEYPGGFTQSTEGKQRAKARLSELRRDADVCRGVTPSLKVKVGSLFAIDGADETLLNGEYVATSLSSSGRQSDTEGLNFTCEVDFRGIPRGALYAPPRSARRPRIAGIQTAIVTGSDTADQSIHCDEQGRIKVRFYWDRIGQQNDESSCWIRTNQLHLGGCIILPRLGWEVAVGFRNGDPDQPVVLGRVYNAQNPPPMSLPGDMASSCMRSMSSPSAAGRNEISMGDSAGKQGFNVKAQKDLNMTSGNDVAEEIGVDDFHKVNENMARSVGSNCTTTVSGNQKLNVGENFNTKVDGDQTIDVTGSDTSNATGNFLEKIGGSRSNSVDGTKLVICNGVQRNIATSFTRTVGAVQATLAGKAICDNILSTDSSSVGAVRVHICGGSHGETVSGAKSEKIAAAALHCSKGSLQAQCGGAVGVLIGGVSLKKVDGDLVVKAPAITLTGGVGQLKGGGSQISLNGGPITIKGSKVSIKAAMIKRTSGSLKKG